MLRHLSVDHYTIISHIDANLSPGLNVITGETGAGKSILAGALSLILGDRADTSVLLHGARKCIVEGSFEAKKNKPLADCLAEFDLDASDEIVLRREINAGGKSRAFVNDTPVNLEQMRRISALLVDLHRQFDTLSLGETVFQLAVLDALASNGALVKTYAARYEGFTAARRKLIALKEQQAQADRESDYHRFLFDELEEAGFAEGEIEGIDAEMKLLNHAAEIKAMLAGVSASLDASDDPIVQRLKSLGQQVQAFASWHPGLPALAGRLHSARVELQDIAGELSAVDDGISVDPARLEKLNDRMALAYRLLTKHGVKTTGELLAIRAGLESRLQSGLDLAASIHALEKETEAALADLKKQAAVIGARRLAAVPAFETSVNGLLKKVGMPNAGLKVSLEAREPGPAGADAVDFLFDANKSGRFEPIAQVASGGELSRLMLCIKSLVARSMDMPTLLFDEIDAGISGEAARQVGILLKNLSEGRQIICITHQPQIAGKGDVHYFVYKEVRGDRIETNIRLLDADERVMAIARMLSGDKPTAAALENAREMVRR